MDFIDGLRETVQWYVENRDWWQALKERETVQECNWPDQKG